MSDLVTKRLQDASSLSHQLVARSNDENATASLVVGQVSNIDTSGVVTVTIGGVDFTNCFFLSTALPSVGDNVLVLNQNNIHYVVGDLQPTAKPLQGTVTVVPSGSKTITVSTPGGLLSVPFLASYTPTVNDIVVLGWFGSTAVVIGECNTTPAAPAPTPAPKPKPPTITTGTTTFAASSSGTYRTGDGWRNDANGNVIQGVAPGYSGDNYGAWFYGGRIRTSLSGATVTDAKIWLERTQGGVYAAEALNLYRITNESRPSGNVSFTATETHVSLAVGQAGWFDLPNSFVQTLVTSGGALGIQSSPYMRMYGVPNFASAGALKISWKK